MLKFTITEDFRTFKAGTEVVINLDELFYLPLVGKNGSGKSTLFHALRGKFPRPEEINLTAGDWKKFPIKIETDYQAVYFLDAVIDDGSDMMNAYTACSFIDSGGFERRHLSHGQKSLSAIGRFLREHQETPKVKSLIVLDEVDTGFDLTYQSRYDRLASNLAAKGYHIVVITHNALTMLNSHVVYDLERALDGKNPVLSASLYLKEKLGDCMLTKYLGGG